MKTNTASRGDLHVSFDDVEVLEDAEADFLSGGDARALRCEPDEHDLLNRSLGPVPPTLYLTPSGPECC